MSLKTRIMFLVSLLVVAGIWSLASVVASVLQANLEEIAAQHLSATLGYVADQIDHEMQFRVNTLNKLAAAITSELQADPSRLQRLLAQSDLASSLFPEGVTCTDSQGIIYADSPVLAGRQGGSLKDRKYFHDIMNGATLAISGPLLGRFVKQPVVILAVPLRDALGATTGALVGTAELSDPGLFGLLEQTKIGKTGYFIVGSPKHGLIVSATDRSRILQPMTSRGVNPLLDRRLDEGYEGPGIGINSQGIEVLTLSRTMKTTGWIAVAGIATEEAFAPIATLKRQIYLGALLVTLLVALILRWVLKRQLAPLADATAAMRRMSEGEHALVPIRVAHQDEIGELVENFNRLVVDRNRLDDALRREIAERKTAEEEVKNLAFYDPLTRLPNRRMLRDRLQQALASSTRSERHGALLFIDLDNFKTLNDTLGHDVGDLLLQQVAQRLSVCVREGDTVARLGGDEFVVMLEDLNENDGEAATQAETAGEKVIATLNRPYQLGGYEHYCTPSIGVTLFIDRHDSDDELLKRADLAMYHAKASGRNTLRFFDPEMQALVTTRAALEADLREAVRQRQFVLYYQPQVLSDGRLTGAEALLRWQHPQRGLVPPLEFIALAEDTGLILALGHSVLETACAQLAVWAARPEMAHLTVAVNVSARQFRHKDFLATTLAVLDHTGASPQRLKLEVTESLLLTDMADIPAKMAALRDKGVRFSLDDFGTGYSSLTHLKRLPLDQLKIDQSFVRDALTNPDDCTIARTIIALGKNLGLSVIAEGVETGAQRDLLAESGCDAYQGYLFSHPLPWQEFDEYAEQVSARERRLDA